jgi:hypothetical protein
MTTSFANTIWVLTFAGSSSSIREWVNDSSKNSRDSSTRISNPESSESDGRHSYLRWQSLLWSLYPSLIFAISAKQCGRRCLVFNCCTSLNCKDVVKVMNYSI